MTRKIGENFFFRKSFFRKKNLIVFFSTLFESRLVMMHDDPPNGNVSRRRSITLMCLGRSAGHVRGPCCACQASYICLWSFYVDRSTALLLSIFDLPGLCF